MRKALLLIAVLGLLSAVAGRAQAAIITFDFRNANSLSGFQTATITQDGYQLEIEAWTPSWAPPFNNFANLGSPLITHAAGQGLGVSSGNSLELDANVISGSPNVGYQDHLSFKIVSLPSGVTAKYKTITYWGLNEWKGNDTTDAGEFSQARLNTAAGGQLETGTNPLGTNKTTDQLGLADEFDKYTLPENFQDGIYYLLAGPRLAGINNSGTAGAGDSFRIAEVQIEIVPVPAAVWLLGTGLAGLVALKKRGRK